MDNKEAKYIDRIEIKGLWGRYDVDWKLNPDVNILVGENGTGKSTILDLIYSSFETNFTKKNLKEIFIEIKITYYHSGSNISHFISIPGEGFYVDKNNLIKDKVMGVVNTTPRHSININFISTFDKVLFEKNEYDKLNKPYILTHLDKELDEIIDKYVDYRLTLSNKIIYENLNPETVFKKWTFLISAINQLFEGTDKKVVEKENRLAFMLDDGTKISPYQLSSGEKQLLIILITVLCQDEKPSVLIMDEPEMSLHFEWQYELIKIIRTLNPNCQLIIATHSSSIFAKGWMDKLFFIEEANGKGIRKKILQTA